jgi:sugar phosphate permease
LIARGWLSENFYIPGVLSILGGLAVLLLIKDNALVPAPVVFDADKDKENVPLDFKKNVYFNPKVLKLCIVSAFAYLAYTTMADMGSLILVAKGFSKLTAIKIMLSFCSCAFLSGFIAAMAAKKLFKNKIVKVVRISFFLMSFMFLVMAF